MVSSSSVKVPVDRKKRYRKIGTVLAGVGVALFVLVLYLRTLAPTVLYLESPLLLDAAMLQMQVCVLGITHPTGYPTYLIMSHLFTYLPFGDCAYRVNLASAVYAALAVLVVFAAGYLLSRRVAAAAAAALAFGVGGTLWSQAVIAEVYTLNALLVALTLLVLLLWRERRRDRYLLLCAFLVGLSMTNHLTSGLLLPASFLFVALVDWRKLVDARLALKGVGLFLLGLTPYLYLPIRAAMDPPFGSQNPTSLEGFWRIISGGNLRSGFFAFGPAELPERIIFYAAQLLSTFNWWLLAAGVVGLVTILTRDRAVALLLGFLFSGWLLFAIENNIPDIHLYFIPTYLVLALTMAVGLGLLLAEAEDLLARFPRIPKGAVLGVLSVALLLLPLPGAGSAYARSDMSEDYRGREILEDVAENAKPNATILHHRSNLWYMVLVEKRRRDLTLVDPFSHATINEVRYASLVWPDDDIDLQTMNRRYGTGDSTGVSAAKKAATKGPVYLLDEERINLSNFRNAGFRTVRVGASLSELVPPERKRYASER
jgi:Protein of unknown function (DUF2723)